MDKYLITKTLGEGAFGRVLLATNKASNETVAIKVRFLGHLPTKKIPKHHEKFCQHIKKNFPTWEEATQLRELKSLMKVRRSARAASHRLGAACLTPPSPPPPATLSPQVKNHKNIVKLSELVRENQQLYFIFEFVSSNLYEEITSRRGTGFTEAEIHHVMYQLLDGLAHMHKHGFFHRDIKPENLLCDAAGANLRIADFGGLVWSVKRFGWLVKRLGGWRLLARPAACWPSRCSNCPLRAAHEPATCHNPAQRSAPTRPDRSTDRPTDRLAD
jgi:serine/threonine protein kinase